jgi:cell division transport system permease protein
MTNQRMTARVRGSLQAYFARHAQTLVGSLGRMVNQPFATLMTMGVVAVALALPLLLSLFLSNMRTASGNWNDAFDLSVYMNKKAGGARAAAVAKQLRQRDDVATVRVITADQALAEFRDDSGFGKALDALSDNPLPDTLIVTPTLAASTPQGTDALKQAIAAIADVQTVQLDTEWVKRLHAMLDILRRVVVLTAGLLGMGVVLIVGNTIRLDILNRRAEIEVMKLVGASDGFTRRPFLYSGIWYGLGGGLMALILVALAAVILAKPVDTLAKAYGSQFHLKGLGFTAAAGVLALAVALAWLGSWLAATRHIRGIEPT